MDKTKDGKAFFGDIQVLAKAFKQPKQDKSDLEIYWRGLSDLDYERVRAGVNHVIRTRVFSNTMPTVGEIRQAAVGRKEDIAALAITRIEIAWQRGIDIAKNVNFKDPLLHQVIVNAGGWVSLCNTLQRDWRFLRKDLERQYMVFLDNPQACKSAPEILWGCYGEVQNREMLEGRGQRVTVDVIGHDDHIKTLPYVGNRTPAVCEISHTPETAKKEELTIPEDLQKLLEEPTPAMEVKSVGIGEEGALEDMKFLNKLFKTQGGKQ